MQRPPTSRTTKAATYQASFSPVLAAARTAVAGVGELVAVILSAPRTPVPVVGIGVVVEAGVDVGAVGTAVGAAVGPAVGAVGAAVGPAVGAAVGPAVGDAVGAAVGAAVGIAVGVGVSGAAAAVISTRSRTRMLMPSGLAYTSPTALR